MADLSSKQTTSQVLTFKTSEETALVAPYVHRKLEATSWFRAQMSNSVSEEMRWEQGWRSCYCPARTEKLCVSLLLLTSIFQQRLWTDADARPFTHTFRSDHPAMRYKGFAATQLPWLHRLGVFFSVVLPPGSREWRRLLLWTFPARWRRRGSGWV